MERMSREYGSNGTNFVAATNDNMIKTAAELHGGLTMSSERLMDEISISKKEAEYLAQSINTRGTHATRILGTKVSAAETKGVASDERRENGVNDKLHKKKERGKSARIPKAKKVTGTAQKNTPDISSDLLDLFDSLV